VLTLKPCRSIFAFFSAFVVFFILVILLEGLKRELIRVELLLEHLFVFFRGEGFDIIFLVVIEVIIVVFETPAFSHDPEPSNVAASDLITPIILIVVVILLVDAHRTVGYG